MKKENVCYTTYSLMSMIWLWWARDLWDFIAVLEDASTFDVHRLGTVRYGYNWRPPQVVAKVPALLHVVIQSAGILRESFHLGRGAQKHHIHFLLCTFPSPTPSSKPLSLLITHYTDNRSHSQPSSWVSPTSFPRLASPVCCWFSAASCRCAKNHTVLDNWVKTRSYIVG